MEKETKLVIAGASLLLVIGFVSWSTGYVERTQTPPLVKLTLSQSGCEFVARSGIADEVKNGICTLTVRYRRNRLNDGGVIEKSEIRPIMISSGQVISVTELDDGSDEPWSEEHRQALAIWIASLLLLSLPMWMLLITNSRGKNND